MVNTIWEGAIIGDSELHNHGHKLLIGIKSRQNKAVRLQRMLLKDWGANSNVLKVK